MSNETTVKPHLWVIGHKGAQKLSKSLLTAFGWNPKRVVVFSSRFDLNGYKARVCNSMNEAGAPQLLCERFDDPTSLPQRMFHHLSGVRSWYPQIDPGLYGPGDVLVLDNPEWGSDDYEAMFYQEIPTGCRVIEIHETTLTPVPDTTSIQVVNTTPDDAVLGI